MMFHSRKADAPTLSAGKPEADIAPRVPYTAPTSTFGLQEKAKAGHHSIVDEHLNMKGDLESDGDILVKGKVFGNIKCKLLIIDTDASVEGGVVAEEVIIRGTTKGTINANRVKLEKTANVDSEICHQTFAAEEGARITGALRFAEEPLEQDLARLNSHAA
ncbi:MAG TPA: polymer-forming cytoskeletal protein [Hyphomicrobiaceae bacterium]|nr:polymer-forming cytoskeletal protein [Hyphomicrobiaceae bacterium]